LCLPVALFCIARLLTDRAYGRREVGDGAIGHEGSVGSGRLLLLSVVLGVLFLFIFFGSSLVAILSIAPRLVAAFIGFASGFYSTLAISRVLLNLWGFEVGPQKRIRRIAAGVFAFTVAAWIFSLGSPLRFG